MVRRLKAHTTAIGATTRTAQPIFAWANVAFKTGRRLEGCCRVENVLAVFVSDVTCRGLAIDFLVLNRSNHALRSLGVSG
jgi:hypothetical protein